MRNPISRRGTLKALGTAIGIGAGGGWLATRPARATTEATIERDNGDRTLRTDAERCAVAAGLLGDLDAVVGEQIRVGADRADHDSALYTVVDDGAPRDVVEMGNGGLDRLGAKNKAAGTAGGYAPHPDYETRPAAAENDEFAEVLRDDGEQSALVACAPHGGWIKYPTDRQSAHVADALGAAEWSCAGYNSGGGAFDRWHVTSTAVDRRSFPKLDRIADRGFDHAVSFHGFSEDGIAVGGGAPRSLRAAVRDEIDAATDGRYDVPLADPGGAYAGNSPESFVNWLASDGDGVQIEQS
jgi:phage replication-related protein YjqB (UPF0714/DUF867 family)